MKKYIHNKTHNKYKKKLNNYLLKKGDSGLKINEFQSISKEQKTYIQYFVLKNLKKEIIKKKIKL